MVFENTICMSCLYVISYVAYLYYSYAKSLTSCVAPPKTSSSSTDCPTGFVRNSDTVCPTGLVRNNNNHHRSKNGLANIGRIETEHVEHIYESLDVKKFSTSKLPPQGPTSSNVMICFTTFDFHSHSH